MPLEIKGVAYFTGAEVASALGVSRVTLWRWRQEGKIPPGHRLRGRQVIFTSDEAQTIRDFAVRIEPIGGTQSDQLVLFGSNPKRT